jgi:hypothetical protein
MIRYRVDLHAYHYVIAILFLMDFATIIARIMELYDHNSTGHFSNGINIFALVMMSLMDAVFRMVMLFLATGFQIVSHTIGRTRRFVVIAVCLAYFGSSVSSSILRASNRLHGYAGSGAATDFGASSPDDDEVAQLIFLLVSIPLLILDAVFWGWAFIGLEKTIRGLHVPRLALDAAAQNRDIPGKTAKYAAFLQYRKIMLVSVSLAFIVGFAKLYVSLFAVSTLPALTFRSIAPLWPPIYLTLSLLSGGFTTRLTAASRSSSLPRLVSWLSGPRPRIDCCISSPKMQSRLNRRKGMSTWSFN